VQTHLLLYISITELGKLFSKLVLNYFYRSTISVVVNVVVSGNWS